MKNKDAFSLIELMVVIAIVAVLSAIAIPAYKEYIERAKMQSILKIIQQQMQLWTNVNDLGNWSAWGSNDWNRPITDPSLNILFVDWDRITLEFNAGYFERQGPTTVIYTPVVDGQVVDVNGPVSQLNGAKIISWSCDVSGPGSVYADGITVLDFQKRYFPSCTCLTC